MKSRQERFCFHRMCLNKVRKNGPTNRIKTELLKLLNYTYLHEQSADQSIFSGLENKLKTQTHMFVSSVTSRSRRQGNTPNYN